ncbi:phosphotransferase [Paenibacillus sp. PK4536]|uniref:phosphotransferase n=1 Tax=Paenibacillus sp. PK4536 TaxID=3024576 RepID=UPI002359B112|nr:phosphotransferase [Paenibacillus sp. PK4536]WIM40063.1 phosphotransferase [Paenibacillus sp. PK4536]
MQLQPIAELLRQAITAEAELDDRYVSDRQIIYTTLHHHHIERFRLNANHQTYIFKPLSLQQQCYQELWTYTHVMPLLPDLYPQLLAYSATDKLSFYSKDDRPAWIILEDAGTLNHVHSEQTLFYMIDQMVKWHRIPILSIPELPGNGQKPSILVMTEQLLSQWDTFEIFVHQHIKPNNSQTRWLHRMPVLKQTIQQHSWTMSEVLCHGDLHAGNYGYNLAGRCIILDWEHCHRNTPLWDLYHLIDLSHPLFPRAMNIDLRLQLLSYYWEQQVNPTISKSQMIQEYVIFAIVFSSWMLLLIQQDLQQDQPIWSHEQLRLQQTEVGDHLEQCIQMWHSTVIDYSTKEK